AIPQDILCASPSMARPPIGAIAHPDDAAIDVVPQDPHGPTMMRTDVLVGAERNAVHKGVRPFNARACDKVVPASTRGTPLDQVALSNHMEAVAPRTGDSRHGIEVQAVLNGEETRLASEFHAALDEMPADDIADPAVLGLVDHDAIQGV